MRVNNWTAKLNAIVESRRHAPFQWGVNDCLLWPADVVLALTGEDPALEYRGTYNSALSAMRIVKEHGDMRKLICRQLNRVPTTLKNAQRGDVVLYKLNGRDHGGVCLGTNAAFVTSDGLTFVLLKHLEPICWRVG